MDFRTAVLIVLKKILVGKISAFLLMTDYTFSWVRNVVVFSKQFFFEIQFCDLRSTGYQTSEPEFQI